MGAPTLINVQYLRKYMRDKDTEPLRAKEAPGEPVVGADGAEWEVEEIRDARTARGRKEYLLKWKGFDRPTWAAARDLTHCKELLFGVQAAATTATRQPARTPPRLSSSTLAQGGVVGCVSSQCNVSSTCRMLGQASREAARSTRTHSKIQDSKESQGCRNLQVRGHERRTRLLEKSANTKRRQRRRTGTEGQAQGRSKQEPTRPSQVR